MQIIQQLKVANDVTERDIKLITTMEDVLQVIVPGVPLEEVTGCISKTNNRTALVFFFIKNDQ